MQKKAKLAISNFRLKVHLVSCEHFLAWHAYMGIKLNNKNSVSKHIRRFIYFRAEIIIDKNDDRKWWPAVLLIVWRLKRIKWRNKHTEVAGHWPMAINERENISKTEKKNIKSKIQSLVFNKLQLPNFR